MSILDITPKDFNVINDDAYNFSVVHSVRAANSRSVRFAQKVVLNRIKCSHSLNPDYIKDLIESWFPADDFYAVINIWPTDEQRVMSIEVRRRQTMTNCTMFGPEGLVFEINIDKKFTQID